jgi:hypothetical protein
LPYRRPCMSVSASSTVSSVPRATASRSSSSVTGGNLLRAQGRRTAPGAGEPAGASPARYSPNACAISAKAPT